MGPKLMGLTSEKAEEIDPRLPEIHVVKAAVLLTRDWDWEGAEREVQLAEQLASVPCNVPESMN